MHFNIIKSTITTITIILLFAIKTLAQPLSESRYFVTGKIVDAYKQKPLSGVTLLLYQLIELEEGHTVREWVNLNPEEVFQKRKGEFLLTLEPQKSYELYFSLEGYASDQHKIVFKKRNIAPNEKISIQVKMVKGNGCYLQANIQDFHTKENLKNALMTIVDDDTKEAISILKRDENPILMPLKGGHRYHVEGSAEGYLRGASEPIGTTLGGHALAQINVSLQKFDSEKPWRIQKEIFEVNKACFNVQHVKELDQIVHILNQYPDYDLEITCHTDSRGDDDYNLILTQKRAEAIAFYLKDKGVPSDRLLPLGFGENMLINDCTNGVRCNQLKHEENRRVELRLLPNF